MSMTIISNGDSGLDARTTINDNFTELYGLSIDASVYGFSETASASDNVTALQAALDRQGIITVKIPGTYDLDETIIIKSNTSLICAPGVIFRKAAYYTQIIRNEGAATGVDDENIVIKGLQISENGYAIYDPEVYGLKANIAFARVDGFVLEDFKCLDLGTDQYCFQISNWENIVLRDIHIEGEKDGLDFGPGHNALIENYYASTADDAIAIFTKGYPANTYDIGDIYNITFRNFTDATHSGSGYSCRPMLASWDDWLSGNTYKTGDACLNAGNLYICNNNNGFSGTGTVAPVHASGSVTGADGVTWRYLHAETAYKADIYNITFENCIIEHERQFFSVLSLDDDDIRQIYPGTETLSSIYNIQMNNVKILDTGIDVCHAYGNLKDISWNNCIFDNVDDLLISSSSYPGNDRLNVTISGCNFKNMSGQLIGAGLSTEAVMVNMSGNTYENFTGFVNVTNGCPCRVINDALPLTKSYLSGIVAEVGDAVMTDEGPFIYQNGGWLSYASMGVNLYVRSVQGAVVDNVSIDLKIDSGMKVLINWGDGTSEVVTGDGTLNTYTSDYSTNQTYLISISGSLDSITDFEFNSANSTLYFDITELEKCTNIEVFSSKTIADLKGTITNLTTLTELDCNVANTFDGSITGLVNMRILKIGGSNTCTGSIAAMSSLIFVYLYGNNTCAFDVGSTPDDVYYLRVGGGNQIVDYTSPHTWKSTISSVIIAPDAGYGLSTEEVDDLLIDLDSAGMSSGGVVLSGNNAARSTASDTAVSNLTGRGVSVTTN